MDVMDGVIVLDKPAGISSHDAVRSEAYKSWTPGSDGGAYTIFTLTTHCQLRFGVERELFFCASFHGFVVVRPVSSVFVVVDGWVFRNGRRSSATVFFPPLS